MASSQEVTALRKAGLLMEAYEGALRLLAEEPDDSWSRRAMGWVLYDRIKAAVSANQLDVATQLIREVDDLGMEPEEVLFHEQFEKLKKRATPSGLLLSRAKLARENGHAAEALRLCRQAVAEFPEADDAHISLGWELMRALSTIGLDAPAKQDNVKDLLREYVRLRVNKPDKLHSQILYQAARLLDANDLIKFVKRWDLQNLRDEDHQVFVVAGRPKNAPQQYSLAEKVLMKVAKAATHVQSIDVAWVLPPLEEASVRHPDNIWLNYRKVGLLLGVARIDEAREVAQTVIRKKPSEAWAWRMLGETYQPVDEDKAIACYCRAVQCSSDEALLGDTRVFLGRALSGRGLHAEAKHEIMGYQASRVAQGYRVPPEVLDLVSQSWYTEVEPTASNEPLYASWRGTATAILLDGIAWMDGVIVTHQLANEDKKERAFIYVSAVPKPLEARASVHLFEKRKVPPLGTPVRVKVDVDDSGRSTALAVERRDGELWDLFPEKGGVIVTVVSKDNVSYIAFSRGRSFPASHSRFPAAAHLREGDYVRVRVRSRSDKGPDFYEFLTVETTKTAPSPDFYQKFSGEFVPPHNGRDDTGGYGTSSSIGSARGQTPCQTYGFIEDSKGNEIYVAQSQVIQNRLFPEDYVTCYAVLEKKKRGGYGWRAVRLVTEAF